MGLSDCTIYLQQFKRFGKEEDDMATYQQDDDHDRITHMDVLNLLRSVASSHGFYRGCRRMGELA